MPIRSMIPLVALLGLLLAVPGCKKDSNNNNNNNNSACTTSVAPSGGDDRQAVQTAIIEAGANGTVCFAAGNYQIDGMLTIGADGVTLQGEMAATTVLDFSGQTTGAQGIDIAADNVTLMDLQVLDTPGDGIKATDVVGISFINVNVIWTAVASLANGAYGLYPVGCTGVLIDNCLVIGARDAGIYVGQSTNIIVRNSEAQGNVAGIEIENSTDAEVVDNWAHDNTAGILIFNLPELPVQDGRRSKVHRNIVENNNLANFADPGTIVANVPAGTGIMLLATDENEVHDNTISGNGSLGVIIVTYIDVLYGLFNDAAYDIYAQTNYIHDNTYSNNGTDPKDIVLDFANQAIIPTPIPNIVWDGCEDAAVDNSTGAFTNCVDGTQSYYNFDYCGGFLGGTADASNVTCSHPSLPSVTLQ